MMTGDANQAENDLRQGFRRRQSLEITIAWSCGPVLLLWGRLLIDHCNPRFVTEGADDDIGLPVVPGWLVLPLGFGLLGLP
jgi:hypothetical protein